MLHTIRQSVTLMLGQIERAMTEQQWKDPTPRVRTLRDKLRKLMENDPAPINEIRIKHTAQELASLGAEAIKTGKWRPVGDGYPDGMIQMAREFQERRYIEINIPRQEAADVLRILEQRGGLTPAILRWILQNLNYWDEGMLARLKKVIAAHDSKGAHDMLLANALLMAIIALGVDETSLPTARALPASNPENAPDGTDVVL